MLWNKYFWMAIIIFTEFIVVWVMKGLGFAIPVTIVTIVFFLFMLGAMRGARRRRRIYYDDDENYDEEIVVGRPRRTSPSSFDRAKDLHVPRISKEGAKFITGDLERSRRRQQSDMRRIRKNLGSR